MSRDRDHIRMEEANAVGIAVGGSFRSEDPGPAPVRAEVPVFYPLSSFGGMPAQRPPPEQSPDVRVYQ